MEIPALPAYKIGPRNLDCPQSYSARYAEEKSQRKVIFLSRTDCSLASRETKTLRFHILEPCYMFQDYLLLGCEAV